jgi:uncharacterized protein YndB with AHSA1/START domain
VAIVTVERQLPLPPEAAFDAVADFTSSAVWDPGVASTRRLDDGPVTLGSRFELRYRFGPVTLPLVYEITRYERPGRVVLTTRSLLHVGEDDVRFAGTSTHTDLTWRASFGVRGAGLLLEPLLRIGFPRVAEEAGDGLATHLASLPARSPAPGPGPVGGTTRL